ncbi:MAG: hypothetical protein MUP98_03720 [Candidatus Aminicenantes bacterium]|nr:hypothetical protein [Candidatus Aminicenantes bacterium]
MRAIYAFGLLILLAFLGSRLIVQRKKYLSPLTFLFLSGLIYIFVGFYLGKEVLNVLSHQVLQGFTPLIGLGLGWVGFLFGFQLEFKYLRRFPGKYLGLSYLQFLFTFIVVFTGLFFLLKVIYATEPLFLLYGMALALGLLISLNSPTLINASLTFTPKRGQYFYLARFLVSVSGFWGVVGLALLFSFWQFPFSESKAFVSGCIRLLASTVFPVFMGFLFHVLTKRKNQEQDLLVYLLGLVFFVSGAAFYFNLPPLYLGMGRGVTFSNLTKIQEKIYPLLLATEKPLFIIFLLLIGALWEFNVDYKIALLVVVTLALRVMGYTVSLPVIGHLLRFPLKLSPAFGLSFLSSGGIGVAFAVSLKLTYPLPLTDIFLSVALLSIILGEILSPLGLKYSLFRRDSEEKT